MSLIKYRALLTVLEYGSLTKAANELEYTQPGVSRMIRSLEDEYGLPLTQRNGSVIQPTAECEKLLPHFREMIVQEDRVIRIIGSLKKMADGSIRAGAMTSMMTSCLPDLLFTYKETYPNVDLQLEEMAKDDLLVKLKENEIDIAFISEFEDPNLEFIPLFEDPILLLVNKRSPLSRYAQISLEDLNDCSLIMFTPDADDLMPILTGEKVFSPSSNYYVSSDRAGILMVSKNLGAYIMTRLEILNEPLEKNLQLRELTERPCRTMGIGIRKKHELAPALKEFIKLSCSLLENWLSSEETSGIAK